MRKPARLIFLMCFVLMMSQLAGFRVSALVSNKLTGNQQWLVDNQFLRGSNGDLRLGEPLKRTEAAVMICRLLGKENIISENQYIHPFTDVPSWASGFVGYLYQNGITKGVSETLYDPDAKVSMQEYVALVLRALGYGEQFTYENTLAYAKQIKLLTTAEISAMSGKIFTRSFMAEVTFHAMETTVYGKGTLANELMLNGVLTAQEVKELSYVNIPTARVTGALPDIREIPTQKVLVLNYDPILEARGGIRLHDLVDRNKDLLNAWNDPRELAKNYITAFSEVTNGFVRYEIVKWIDVDAFVRDTKGFQYTDETYLATYEKAVASGEPYYSEKFWHPARDPMDTEYYLKTHDIINQVQRGEVDEVWVFSGPCTGVYTYETQMIGDDAYWCNSPAIQKDGVKPFVVYFFNFERGVDCMLENSGHRLESIMRSVFGRWDYKTPYADMNKWELFTLYDQVLPGKAACGNVHFAPNSVRDYDWGNTRQVTTSYIDWLDYPNLTGEKTTANTAAWGNGNMYLHHMWWFSLIPKTDGTDTKGYYNNWWLYYVYPTYFQK